MKKIFLYAFIFFNILSVAIANVKPQDQFSSDIYDSYDDCVREKTTRAHYLLFEYDLENYHPISNEISSIRYECNKILEFVTKDQKYNDIILKYISNNEQKKNNNYIDIYYTYHYNIIWNSRKKDEILNSLNEIENNYLKNSNLENNLNARGMLGTLGWFYNTNEYFFNFNKAHYYLTKAIDYNKFGTKTYSEHSLKYHLNNLGVVYDQDRFGNLSKKKNNQIAFDYYIKAADLGLHHAYNNIAKFYLLGLANVKKDYDKAIKNYKLSRIASYGDENYSDLKILYKKKRAPNDLNEYLKWLEEYAIASQDPEVFQQIAWMVDENEVKKNDSNTYITMYMWQYLCKKYCPLRSDKNRSISEIKILENKYLSTKAINIAKKNALNWENKNWNRPIKELSSIETENNKDLITDVIKNAFMKKKD